MQDDPSLESVVYTCQGETKDDLRKGFFDTPTKEDEWPRCLEGTWKNLDLKILQTNISFSSTLSNTS